MRTLGIDIGGTFTDVVLSDEETGDVYRSKVPTTPEALAEGVKNGVKDVLEASKNDGSSIRYVAHGTTVATNAVLEGKGARTALISTKGISDVLEIRHRARPAGMIYDMHLQWPEPLVPRFLRFGVDERIDSQGRTLKAPSKLELDSLVDQLRKSGVESAAICYLWSFLRPANEVRTERALRRGLKGIYTTRSSDLLPKIGEYERMSTVVVNAYVGPLVDKYLQTMKVGLGELGVRSELFIMQSNGGVTTASDARRRPAAMIESGPAAGVAAAAHLGRNMGVENLIAFDMGGTTVKACVIKNEQPNETPVFQTGGVRREGQLIKGTGFEIAIPSVDLVEIGSGGGSQAWLDEGGKLRVGPKSAGASPGPACYGKGGTEPTVTDADLVLGYLNPDYFLGGKMKLFKEKSIHALERLGRHFGMDALQVANGVFKILNSQISDTLRLVSTKRGYDIREFAIVAFGGAGPVHGPMLLEELGAQSIIIPPYPGLHSAVGLIESDLVIDFLQTYIVSISQASIAKMELLFKNMEAKGGKVFSQGGIPHDTVRFERLLNLRYENQGSILSVSLTDSRIDDEVVAKAVAEFHRKHLRTYGFESTDANVELTDLRVRAMAASGRSLARENRNAVEWVSEVKDANKGTRKAYFDGAGDFVECDTYDRDRLATGSRIIGPAIIEQIDTTIVVPPNYVGETDSYGNMIVKKS